METIEIKTFDKYCHTAAEKTDVVKNEIETLLSQYQRMHVDETIFPKPTFVRYRAEDIRSYVDLINTANEGIFCMDNSPQRFCAERRIETDLIGNVHGTLTLTSVEKIPVLSDLLGMGMPFISPFKRLIVRLRSESDIQDWREYPENEVIELPYRKVSLFPSVTGNDLDCLLYVGSDGDKLETMFFLLCRFILLDIIREKLNRAVSNKEFVESTSGVITLSDLTPYFSRRDNKWGRYWELFCPVADQIIRQKQKLAESGILGPGQIHCTPRDERDRMLWVWASSYRPCAFSVMP